MDKDEQARFALATGRDETVAAIEDLRAKFERGEISAAALRVYKADGTWEDIVLGESEEARSRALEQLQQAFRSAH